MLFIAYSSTFNTIVPSKLVFKFKDLGLCNSICRWIYNFVTRRLQWVRVKTNYSSTVVLNTGAPQGCCLSPVLYNLFIYDIIKTSLLSLQMIKQLLDLLATMTKLLIGLRWLTWLGLNNNLFLNVAKIKEVIIDFRKSKTRYLPVCINNATVEIVNSFKFLGIHIANSFSWFLNIKKAQQRLFFLRCLKKYSLSTKTAIKFYRSTMESIITGSTLV